MENASNSEKEETDNDDVKSTAVVKYSLPKPANYMKLQCNTDLNLPPSNWLSSSGDSYGLQHVLHHPTGFSRWEHVKQIFFLRFCCNRNVMKC